MDIVLHWTFNSANFVNKGEVIIHPDSKNTNQVPKDGSRNKSAKNKLGHKPNQLNQRTTISIPDNLPIGRKWKKIVAETIDKYSHYFRHNSHCQCYIYGSLYKLGALRDSYTASKRLANIILADRRLKNLTIDNVVKK